MMGDEHDEALHIQRYETNGGYWAADIGGAEWLRWQIVEYLADPEILARDTPEQVEEMREALAAIPGDDVRPTKGQRRRVEPAEGNMDD